MSIKALPLATRLAAMLCLALAGWVTFDLSHWWALKEDYSFGYLVPVFCAYVLYDRWPRIHAIFASKDAIAAPAGSWLNWMGIFALCGFGATFTFGLLYRGYSGVSLPSSFVMTYSFAGIALSSALLFSEKRADGSALGTRERIGFVGLMLFPALIWIISAPLMSAVETKVSVFLLNRVTSVVFTIFDSLGMAIERRANVLILPKGEVGVQEACSGIRSLTGCLFAGSFLAAVFLDRFWKKVLMVLAALVLAFLTNILRSMFLTAWAYAYGSEAIEGTVHDATGYAVLGLTVVLLLCLMPLFNFKLPQPPPYPAPAGAQDEPGEARTEENK